MLSMPSHTLLVLPLFHFSLLLLVALCCLVSVVLADNDNPYRRCDPESAPCAQPEEGTPACSACAAFPQSSACQTAYNQQPATYCGNSTVLLEQTLVSAAACCPLVLDATPVQCVPIEYNVTADGVFLIRSFTCRGKVLPSPPSEDRRLQTLLALLGVVGPICFIMATYALCRLYRRWRTSNPLPISEHLLHDSATTKTATIDSATDALAATYQLPVFRPPPLHSNSQMAAFGLYTSSDDYKRMY